MSDDDKDKFTTALCDSLFEVLERGKLSARVEDLLLTPNIEFADPVNAVMFSGGVSEYVYGYEKRNLGDLGGQLGRKVRERVNKLGGGNIPLRPAEVRIRATVIGASQYTVQVSGNTIYLSHPEMLPLRNLQVITPQFEQKESITAGDIKAAVEKALQRGDASRGRPRRGVGDSLGVRTFLSFDPHSGGRIGKRHERSCRPGTAAGARL